jgi:hypothetical protein
LTEHVILISFQLIIIYGQHIMSPFFPIDPETLEIRHQKAKEVGVSVATDYQSKTPYHYVCIDDFFRPQTLERVREEALAMGDKACCARICTADHLP